MEEKVGFYKKDKLSKQSSCHLINLSLGFQQRKTFVYKKNSSKFIIEAR